jgi:hypothetical protein
MISEGIYSHLSSAAYHNDKDSVSRSMLMDFNKSPYHFWANHINPERPPKEKTPSMELGSAFHTLVLEPHLFEEHYIIKPASLLLKNVGREAYEENKLLIAECDKSEKTLLTQETFRTINEMRYTLFKNPIVMNLLKDAHIEQSFFWKDKETGLMLKSRPDILHSNMIIDLKTTSDASLKSFQSDMVRYGYHVQSAMVREAVYHYYGKWINNVIFILSETKYPYIPAIYMLDEYAIESGYEKFTKLKCDLKEALTKNEWQDYGIQTVSLPNWAI